jgi:Fur family ferric uptake transcriptional regulator
MRNSSADQIIMETLAKHGAHLTSHQIYEEVHDRLPAINPSTVYRALDRLVSTGKVSVSDMGIGASVFELTGEKLHHHLVCQGCGQIILLGDDEIGTLLLQLGKKFNYQITTNHLILFGFCDQCQKHK